MPIDTVLFQTSALATPPAGQKVAVDNLPSGAAQYIKLLGGAQGNETPVLADANGLNVSAKSGYALPVSGSVILGAASPPGTIIGAVTVSGSVVLAAQPTVVIGTVRTQDGSGNPLSSTANALDVNLKTSAITLPISALALPLPALAATSTKQPAFGTAGAGASTDVLTIQGAAGGVAIPVTLPSAPGTIIGTVNSRTMDGVGGSIASHNSALDSSIRDAAGNFRGANVTAASELSVQLGVGEDLDTGGGTVTRPTVGLMYAASGGPVIVSAAFGMPVAMASNQSALANWGHAAIGAASPTGATAEGLRAASTLPAGVADGLLVNAMADLKGRLVNVPLAPRELVADATITLAASVVETTLVPATANEFHDLTTVVVTNTSPTVDTRVDFRDATGGTVRFSLFVPAKQTVGFTLPTPRPQAAVNTNWTAQCATSTTDVRIFAQYIRNK